MRIVLLCALVTMLCGCRPDPASTYPATSPVASVTSDLTSSPGFTTSSPGFTVRVLTMTNGDRYLIVNGSGIAITQIK